MLIKIRDLFKTPERYTDGEINVAGWIRFNRSQAKFGFLDIVDGSCFDGLQIVYEENIPFYADISGYRVGSAVAVSGKLVLTPTLKQPFEIHASSVRLLGDSPENYPIQPKRHTREFLREAAHLRPRTNLFRAVFRIRSEAAMAVHTYFQDKGFLYVNTPLITTADCEGSGQMFKITTMDLNRLPKKDNGEVNFASDLFGKQAYITGSGQLHGEAFAMAFGNIYTFGPTFRTENSNTKTHANEFWMIEPEMAFCDIDCMMDIEEEMLKYIIGYVLKHCPKEILFCDSFVEKGLKAKITSLLSARFKRITHHEAVDILKKSEKKWEFKPDYNGDLAREHEKYLTEYFKGPVFVKDWPKDIKAYYMKQNEDGKTVAAADLIIPGAGELMGGSQREDNPEKLVKRMRELKIDPQKIDWYLDTRRFGGCVHSGFGMGFERLIMYLTGMDNIRDVIPFPRTPRNCEF